MDKKFICIVIDAYYCNVDRVYINKMPSVYDIFRYGVNYIKPDITIPEDDNSTNGVLLLDYLIKTNYPVDATEHFSELDDLFVVSAIVEDGIIVEAKLDRACHKDDDDEAVFTKLNVDLPTQELQKKLLENIYTKWLVKDINFPTHLNKIEESLKLTDEEKRELLS